MLGTPYTGETLHNSPVGVALTYLRRCYLSRFCLTYQKQGMCWVTFSSLT